MPTEVRFHRVLTVLLTAALLATLTVALTGGQRAEAVDGPVEVVYVATGQNFPDALAGANLAATVGAPMLTVNPDLPIPDATITALSALDPDQIIILGGPVAVSEPVADALAKYARSGAVTRIEGGDRHDTAAQIADALPDKVHDADLLDGLDSSAFLRSGTRTEYASCGPFDLGGQLDRIRLVTQNGSHHVGLASGETFASVHCNLAVPEGATITQLGYDARDPDDDGQVVCNALNIWDAETVPPTLLGMYDPDSSNFDPFLGTGIAATPGDVRRATPPNGGPVTAGPRTQVQVQCYLAGGDNVRIYRFFVEYEVG